MGYIWQWIRVSCLRRALNINPEPAPAPVYRSSVTVEWWAGDESISCANNFQRKIHFSIRLCLIMVLSVYVGRVSAVFSVFSEISAQPRTRPEHVFVRTRPTFFSSFLLVFVFCKLTWDAYSDDAPVDILFSTGWRRCLGCGGSHTTWYIYIFQFFCSWIASIHSPENSKINAKICTTNSEPHSIRDVTPRFVQFLLYVSPTCCRFDAFFAPAFDSALSRMNYVMCMQSACLCLRLPRRIRKRKIWNVWKKWLCADTCVLVSSRLQHRHTEHRFRMADAGEKCTHRHGGERRNALDVS